MKMILNTTEYENVIKFADKVISNIFDGHNDSYRVSLNGSRRSCDWTVKAVGVGRCVVSQMGGHTLNRVEYRKEMSSDEFVGRLWDVLEDAGSGYFEMI